jgi:hypothetical protein
MSLLDTASLILTPNGYKASKLYSVKPTDASGDMVVSRGTSATRVDSAGLIELMPIDVPRLDYTGGGCPSILVEPARTNLVLYSEQFDNANWTKTNTTITANSSTSPDGTSNADILVENSASNVVFGVHAASRPSGLTLTTTYSVSFFAKKITRDFCYFNDFNGFQTPAVRVYFNLSTGLVGTSTLGVLNPKMENYGNGWYRCSFQFVATINTSIDYRIAAATSDNTLTYSGTIGQQAIAIWGAQFETGSNATSYIPTTTIPLTRNADVISKTGVSSLIGQTEGTIFIDAQITNFAEAAQSFITISDGTIFNRIELRKSSASQIVLEGAASTGSFPGFTLSSVAVGRYKIAVAYQSGNSYLYINGAQVGTTSANAFAFTSLTNIVVGANATGSTRFLNDRINLATVFQTRLSEPQLQALTAII